MAVKSDWFFVVMRSRFEGDGLRDPEYLALPHARTTTGWTASPGMARRWRREWEAKRASKSYGGVPVKLPVAALGGWR